MFNCCAFAIFFVSQVVDKVNELVQISLGTRSLRITFVQGAKKTGILKTGRFDHIESAVIISCVIKEVQTCFNNCSGFIP